MGSDGIVGSPMRTLLGCLNLGNFLGDASKKDNKMLGRSCGPLFFLELPRFEVTSSDLPSRGSRRRDLGIRASSCSPEGSV